MARTSLFAGLDKKTQVMAYLISVTLTFLPLLYLPGYGSFALIRYAVFGVVSMALGFLALWALFTRAPERRYLFRSIPFYAVPVYLLAYALVSFTSIDPASSFFSTFVRTDGWFTYLFLSLFLLGAYVALVRGGRKILMSWLSSSVIGAVLLSVLIMLSPSGLDLVSWQFLEMSRGGGTIGNSSLAAFYVVWNIFFAFLLLVKASTSKRKTAWGIIIACLLSSSLFINWYVLTGRNPYKGLLTLIGDARASVLAVLVGGFIALAMWLVRDGRIRMRRIGLAGIAIVLVVFLLVGSQVLNASSAAQKQFVKLTSSSRILFWESSMEGFYERPLLGMGPNTFSDVYYRYFDPARFQKGERIEALADKPHNIFFESLVTGGIVLTLALIFYLGALVYLLVKLSKTDRLLGSILLGAFAAWLTQTQFVFDSLSSLALLSLVFAVGLAHGASRAEESATRLKMWHKAALAGYAVAAIVVFVYAISLPLKKAFLMNYVYKLELPARADAWQQLSDISPMGDQYDSELMFNEIFNVYARNAEQLRADTSPLRGSVVDELDAIDLLLSEFIISDKSRLELTLLRAQFQYLRIFVASQVTAEQIKQLTDLTKRALKNAPNNTRAQNLQKGVDRFRDAIPGL